MEDCFEKTVWPNHIKQHADLFKTGDSEGAIDEKVCVSREISRPASIRFSPNCRQEFLVSFYCIPFVLLLYLDFLEPCATGTRGMTAICRTVPPEMFDWCILTYVLTASSFHSSKVK